MKYSLQPKIGTFLPSSFLFPDHISFTPFDATTAAGINANFDALERQKNVFIQKTATIMSLIKVIPKIFYSDISVGLKLFTEVLGFKVLYSENEGSEPFYIIARDAVTLYLIGSDEFAQRDRPEIRLETDDIEGMYAEVRQRDPSLLHPNLPEIRLQPWGLKEFAMRDESGVCVIIHQH